MSMETERWTVERVLTESGWKWTYALRDYTSSPTRFETSEAAARAAKRAWEKQKAGK